MRRTFQKMLGQEGGTTFHFVTDGIHAALDRAVDAAGGRGVRLGGGIATIRQYLLAGTDLPALGLCRAGHVRAAKGPDLSLSADGPSRPSR